LSNQKIGQQNPEMLSLTRYKYQILKISRLTLPQKKPRFAHFFAWVFINELN